MEKTKRILSIFLVVLMLFTSLPMNVFAEETVSAAESVMEEPATEEETTALEEETTTEEVTTAIEEETAAQEETTVTEDEPVLEEITSAEESTEVTSEETTSEEPVYEVGKIYIINGIRYNVRQDGTVSVSGSTEDMPEKVEILAYLGDYPVTEVTRYAFSSTVSSLKIKELVIPETVKVIESGVTGRNLEKVEIRGDYVKIGKSVFANSPFYENEDNWKDDLLIVGSCLIKCRRDGEVILGEEITSVAQDAFGSSSMVDTIKIYNENCAMELNTSGVFPEEVKLCGKEDSTIHQYAKTFDGWRLSFEKLCFCEDTVKKEETPTLCDGTIGNDEGYWCERCQVWQTGGRKNERVTHSDENGDGVCEICGTEYNSPVIKASYIGKAVLSVLYENGTLLICGNGSTFSDKLLSNSCVPWYSHKDNIKKIIIADGVKEILRLGIKEYNALESVDMGSTLEAFTGEINYCPNLKSLKLSESIEKIDGFSHCTALESVVIPASVKEVGFYAFGSCSSLKEIKIEGGYIKFGVSAFFNTPAANNPENIKDGYLYIDNCLIDVITPGLSSLVLGPEITSVAPLGNKYRNPDLKEITVYNPDCVFYWAMALEDYVVIRGLVGSTAQAYAKKNGHTFIPFCICEDTVTVPENDGFCDGTIGYTEGQWCERCQMWASGHEAKTEFFHYDEDEDGVCDYCSQLSTDTVLDSGDCGENISWSLTQGGVLSLIGTGNMDNYDNDSETKTPAAPWQKYAGIIKKAEFSDGIMSIGDYAFYNCVNMESVVHSTVLLSIGAYAFYGCLKLNDTEIPETITSIGEFAFVNCESLKKAVIPEGVSVLNRYMFSGCKALETAEIKSQASAVPVAMFKNCESLCELTFTGKITSVAADSFRNCKRLKSFPSENLTSLGDFAFSGCESFTSFTVNDIATVSYGLLKNCKSLSEIKLMGKITKIDREAFSGCSALKIITIPETVEVVGYRAFENCTALKSIVLPSKVKSLGTRVFNGCESLNSITVLNNNISIGLPVVENGVTHPAIPQCTTVIAEQASAADVYADKYDLSFIPLTNKQITSVVLTKEPDKTVYIVGKDTELDKKGAIVTVTYEDGSVINLENRYAVILGDTDLTNAGEYHPCIIYNEYVFEYKIIASERVEYIGVPENRTFNIYCEKDEWTVFSFTPEETKKYTFSFGEITDLEITGATLKTFSKIKFISQTMEAGTEYQFFMKVKTGKNIKINDIDDVHFELLPDGTYEAKYCLGKGDIVIPAQYAGVAVTKIADDFLSKRYGDLRRITISEGIKEIGDYAFDYYDYRIYLPSTLTKIGVSAFEGSAVSDVVLPGSLVSVGEDAFFDCNQIKELTVLCENATFGKNAFRSCSSLEKINFSGKSVALSTNMFAYCVDLKEVTGAENISSLGAGAFYGCDTLGAFEISGAVKSIGNYAFYECTNLTDVTFNEGLETIGEYAFAYSGIEKAVLPSTLKSMDDRSFGYCKSLTDLVIPEKITTVPYGCFYACNVLENVTVNSDLKTIAAMGFGNCYKLKSLDCWDTVTYIGMEGFAYCSALEYASFGNVTSIGARAFADCTSLRADFTEAYPHIGVDAFKGCSLIEEASVGSGCADGAFESCTSLKKIVFRETKEMGENILNNCSALEEIHFYTSFENVINPGVIPDTVKIYGYPDSSVQKYAEDNGYSFIPVDGHIHSFTVTRSKATKCFMNRYDTHKCSCGYSYVVHVPGSHKEHYYGDFTYDKEPTCTEYGLKSRHCFCGANRKDTVLVEPFGHTEVIDIPAVAPTETAPGYTHQSHCSVCGETVVERELIGHGEYDIQINDHTVTAQKFDAATSEADGFYITITFELKNQAYYSQIDKTVIYKVGKVKLSDTEFTYNGKVQKPSVTVNDSAGEPLVADRDYKLTYSANSKYSGKYSVRVDYIGNYAGSKTLYYDIVIGAVAPSVSSSEEDSITLAWSKGNSDLVYCVFSADSKGNLKKLADTENGSYTVSSLDPGTVYSFLVRAYVKDGKGNIYWGEKGSILVCATAPSKVSRLTVSSETVSAELSWQKVSGATGYRVYKYDGSWKMVRDTSALSCEVSGLKGGTAYKFYVRPYKQFSGKTVWSADDKADAVQTYTKPSAAKKISFTSSSDSVKLSWSKVTGATGYRIYLYDNAKDKYVKVADTSKNTYTVKKKSGKKLKPGVEYRFRVKAYIKKDGKTYWSDSYKTVKTATEPAKTTLTVTSSKGKVNLAWKNVAGESGYQVYYASKKNGKYKKLTSTKTNKVKYSKKLTKGKKYYFKVRSFKKVGSKTVYGSFSSAKSVKIK